MDCLQTTTAYVVKKICPIKAKRHYAIQVADLVYDLVADLVCCDLVADL